MPRVDAGSASSYPKDDSVTIGQGKEPAIIEQVKEIHSLSLKILGEITAFMGEPMPPPEKKEVPGACKPSVLEDISDTLRATGYALNDVAHAFNAIVQKIKG